VLDMAAPMPASEVVAAEVSIVAVENDGAVDSPDGKGDQEKREKVARAINRAKKQWETAAAAESQLRQNQLDDKRFAASKQWPDGISADREFDERPWLTINRLPQFIRQVTNTQRQANLSIKVNPVEDGDVDTAEVLQGLIRHIEDRSDASSAYATAGNDQATIGRGYIRVDAEYSDPRSFVQDLRIFRVRNAFTVYMDPSCQELDCSDARFAFVLEDMPKDEYIDRFGEDSYRTIASLTEMQTEGDMIPDWMPEGNVRVAHWWYVDLVKVEILLVEWPEFEGKPAYQDVLTREEYDKLPELAKAGGMVKDETGQLVFVRPVRILDTRMTDERRVKRALINACEILEGNADKTEGREWPGQWIPIVPVVGDEIDINGKVDYRGMVRDAKDPQRLYNYEKTALAEALALAPLAQWVGYEGQFEGHETKWLQANRRRFPYLEVKNVSLNGATPTPLPQRITSEPPIQAIVVAIQEANNDLQATMGLYQESLGQRSSTSQSGKAITALQQQGELANSNYLDNMTRALRALGRIIVDLIPYYYDAPRIVRIIGIDETEKTVMVHAGRPDEVPSALPPGVKKVYDLSVGKYDVTCSAGPNMLTKRREAAESLTEFIKAFPPAFPFVGDILARTMDFPGAHALGKRLEKMVPPEARDPEDGQAPIPPEVQQQMAQMQQAMQLMEQELMQAKQIIAAKQAEMAGRAAIAERESQADFALAQLKAQSEIQKQQIKTEGDAIIAKLEGQIERANLLLKLAAEAQMAHAQREADREDAVMGRVLDRTDKDIDRRQDREDAIVERQFDRQDSDRTRQYDREDTHAERQAGRQDEAVARQRDREDASSQRHEDRVDATITRQRDREDAEAADKREAARAAREAKTKKPAK
jgi:hypothetical protein